MQVQKVPIDQIKFAPYNPRIMPESELEKLKRSIKEFGFVEPLVVNRRTMHVVGGNQRLKALKELGYKEVDVVFVDLTEEREKVLNIALNKIQGEWDWGGLKELLQELEIKDFDLTLTGFDEDEIERFLGAWGEDIEEPPDEMFAKQEKVAVYRVKVPQEDIENFEKYLDGRGYEYERTR